MFYKPLLTHSCSIRIHLFSSQPIHPHKDENPSLLYLLYKRYLMVLSFLSIQFSPLFLSLKFHFLPCFFNFVFFHLVFFVLSLLLCFLIFLSSPTTLFPFLSFSSFLSGFFFYRSISPIAPHSISFLYFIVLYNCYLLFFHFHVRSSFFSVHISFSPLFLSAPLTPSFSFTVSTSLFPFNP